MSTVRFLLDEPRAVSSIVQAPVPSPRVVSPRSIAIYLAIAALVGAAVAPASRGGIATLRSRSRWLGLHCRCPTGSSSWTPIGRTWRFRPTAHKSRSPRTAGCMSGAFRAGAAAHRPRRHRARSGFFSGWTVACVLVPRRQRDQACDARGWCSHRRHPGDTGSGRGQLDAAGIVYAMPSQGILRVSPNGGKVETVVALKERSDAMLSPVLLPDGDSIMYPWRRRRMDGWDRGGIVVHSIKSGTSKTVLEGGSDARYLPTGHRVRGRRHPVRGALRCAPAAGRRRARPVLEGVRRASTSVSGAVSFAVAGNGSLVFIPGPSARAAGRSI